MTAIYKRFIELFPLTGLGVLVAGVAYWGLSHFGFAQLDLVWYVAALCALMLIVISFLSVLCGVFIIRRALSIEVESKPRSANTETVVNTGFILPALRWLPLLEIQLAWNEPADVAVELRRNDHLFQEWVTPSTHGDVNHVDRRIRISDVLGLTSITLRDQSPGNLAVLPHPGELNKVPWLTSLNGGEDLPHPLGTPVGDRTELQRYQSGDSTRFIHWKAFARTRKLMQRAPERSLSRTQRTAVYLVAGPDDGASAAAALTALFFANLDLDFVFGADGTPDIMNSRDEIEAAVRHSATMRDCGGRDLAKFADAAIEDGATNFMLFLPSSSGDWETKVNSLLRRTELTFKIVVGVDGLEEAKSKPLWYRLMLDTELAERIKTDELVRLVNRLEITGTEVLIADRHSGRMYDAKQLNKGMPSKPEISHEALQTA
ncbi:MAG: DUF58 domain-containing protein [Acidiferrobacterales bacterium]|nr:DUF58 domain-containing protein [Acidiferrobacterales bacterium]